MEEWKKLEKGSDDKVLDALARASNAENGIEELYARVKVIESALADTIAEVKALSASKSKASRATVAAEPAKDETK